MVDRLSQLFFLPSVIFGFAFFAAPFLSRVPRDFAALIPLAPYFVLCLVALLASAFNRGRTLLAAIIIILLALANKYGDVVPYSEGLLLLLVPFNLALLSIIQERGSLTQAGLMRLAFVAAQVGGVIYLLPQHTDLVASWLNSGLLPDRLWPDFMPTSQIALLLALISFAISLILCARNYTPISSSIFGALLGSCFLLVVPTSAEMHSAFLFAIGVLLTNGLLMDYYNMAYRDELTGLPQRRALNEELQSLGSHYTLAMMDVDHFKKFNDTHGHDVGDQVLQMVASQIRKVQGGGKAYRFGGEEFTVVFANRTAEDAAYFLELIRKAIADYEMVIREDERVDEAAKKQKKQRKRGAHRVADKKVSVTISIGVAEKSQRGEQPEDILKKADEALYRAKNAGRNALAF